MQPVVGWYKAVYLGYVFCDLKDVEIVETFRDTSRRLIIAYAVIPSILLNAAQAIMNRMDRKRGA